MSPDYQELPTVQFATFENKYATTDKHPAETGDIELSKEFIKAMVEVARTGKMPVLRVAMWNNVSKAGLPYKNFKLEIKQAKDAVVEAVVEEVKEEDDDFPF
tara:strand:- start:280 stop:585 length:306 start_codon:yes stop_codon:yes gene_type:complete